MNLPQDILKKVKFLDLSTRKLVQNVFAGEYHSAFKGRGIIFSEFREYIPGDDVRAISWPLMAKTGKAYVKKFDEERELVLMLLVDISGSLDFGSGPYFKGEVIAHMAALLGFSASKNKDSLGLLLFSDQIEHFVPPKKGSSQVHRILRDLYFHKPRSQKTNISVALEYLRGILKKRALIFLFSDFIDQGFEKTLKVMGKKHDLIGVVVEDLLEKEMLPLGLLRFRDSETKEHVTLDTSSPFLQRTYKAAMKKRREKRDFKLKRAHIDCIQVDGRKDFIKPLISFFKNRHKR